MTAPIHAAAAGHAIMREELLREFPELAADDEALADTLEGISDFAQAVQAVLRSIDEDQIIVDGVAARIKELTARFSRFDDRVYSKRAAIQRAMERAGEKKIVLPDATLSLKAAAAQLVITDEMALPIEYLVQPPAKPDKKALLADLKTGKPIPGATLSNAGAPELQIRRK